MEYNELRCIVGENCDNYIAKNDALMMSMRVISVSCDNCSNYVRGMCTKGNLDLLKKVIQNN